MQYSKHQQITFGFHAYILGTIMVKWRHGLI